MKTESSLEMGSLIPESEKTVVQAPAASKCSSLWTILLYWCGLQLGAYAGTLIRIGLSYFTIWKVEGNMTVMYCQIIGCIIMGFVTHHKNVLSQSRFHDVVYLMLATGLCGSTTTFSTWNMECTKIVFLQFDIMSMGSSYG